MIGLFISAAILILIAKVSVTLAIAYFLVNIAVGFYILANQK